METINDRMELLVNERFGGNKAAFAKAIAVEPTTLSSYLGTKRRSKPSVDMVAKIIMALNVQVNGANPINGTGAHDNTHVVTADNAVLEERIKSLEALLQEKERLIQILINK